MWSPRRLVLAAFALGVLLALWPGDARAYVTPSTPLEVAEAMAPCVSGRFERSFAQAETWPLVADEAIVTIRGQPFALVRGADPAEVEAYGPSIARRVRWEPVIAWAEVVEAHWAPVDTGQPPLLLEIAIP